MMDYAVVVTKLSEQDGGGYLAVVPDLYGCMSDGATPEEAVKNAQEAVADWLEASTELGRQVPEVGSSAARAKEREQAFILTIRALTESFDGLDGRIDGLLKEIEHLRELIENQNAWYRFDKIVSSEPSRPARESLPC
jgi:predicted RNase H-like HicB family nuclease